MTDPDFDKFFDAVLEILKEKRKEKGLTQEDLGERMGKPQSAIARFESGGVRDPRVSMIFQVCRALKINPADAFGPAFKDFSPAENSQGHATTKSIDSIVEAFDGLNDRQKSSLLSALHYILELAK